MSGWRVNDVTLPGAVPKNCRLTGVTLDGVPLEEMKVAWRRSVGGDRDGGALGEGEEARMGCTLHLLKPRGRLSDIEPDLRRVLAAARLAEVVPIMPLDVVIRAMDQPMPPDLRVTGAPCGPGRMELGDDLT